MDFSVPTRAPSKPAEHNRPDRRAISRRSAMEEARSKVPVIDLVDLLAGAGKMRRSGKGWVTHCVLDDHEDKTPSFSVNPEQNLWYCHGCFRGGDVVELARYAWGYEKGETAMAATDLLHEFGHPVPEGPDSGFAKQERQKPIQDGIDAAKILETRRQLYQRYFEPLVLTTKDDDRAHDAQLFWEATKPLAEHLVANMMEARR